MIVYTRFWDLVILYSVSPEFSGLDLVKDVLFDFMHVFCCHGIIQNVEKDYNKDMDDNRTLTKEERMPVKGGIRTEQNKTDLDQKTNNFPKTPNMRAARFPYCPSERIHRFKGI